MEIKSTIKVCGGSLLRFSHKSIVTNSVMTCAVFLPNGICRSVASDRIPSIMYLSGLTCTDENVCQKGFPFRKLSELNVAFIAPDTSPRGVRIEGDSDSWDFGVGAGFYIDAKEEPWNKHYRMYSYIVEELPAFLAQHFHCLDLSRLSIMGHSMGGHGALTIAMKNQDKYMSVSAFAPICHPSVSPWGVKAFTGYLGANHEHWNEYDATLLLTRGALQKFDDILIDVGTEDNFLKVGQLLPEALQTAAHGVGQKITLRYQEGYDHSYYFVSTFMEDHIIFHATRLNK